MPPYLWHHVRHELLSSKTRLDGHHQNHVHERNKGKHLLHWRLWLDANTNLGGGGGRGKGDCLFRILCYADFPPILLPFSPPLPFPLPPSLFLPFPRHPSPFPLPSLSLSPLPFPSLPFPSLGFDARMEEGERGERIRCLRSRRKEREKMGKWEGETVTSI